MTSKRSLRIETRILPASVLFIAVLSILTAFAVPAQQADARQPSPKVRRQGNQVNKASSSVPGSGSSLFLPAVTYYAGAGATVAAVVADVNGDGKADLVVGDQRKYGIIAMSDKKYYVKSDWVLQALPPTRRDRASHQSLWNWARAESVTASPPSASSALLPRGGTVPKLVRA